MTEKTFKKICKCENCGNEAEMTVTCSLESVTKESAKKHPQSHGPFACTTSKFKGQAVCSQCGNEAEIWLDRL